MQTQAKRLSLIAIGVAAAGLSLGVASLATAQTATDPSGVHGPSNGPSAGPGGAGSMTKGAKSASSSAMSGMSHGADKMFVDKAAMGGMAEVKLSQLAQQKGTSPMVKQYSQKMIDDHTQAGDELKTIATGKGMDVPMDVEPKAKMAMDKLSKMSGAAFDTAYMQQMVADHKETVALFEKESKSGSDADLKAFATKTLPTLQGHLKMAQGDKTAM